MNYALRMASFRWFYLSLFALFRSDINYYHHYNSRPRPSSNKYHYKIPISLVLLRFSQGLIDFPLLFLKHSQQGLGGFDQFVVWGLSLNNKLIDMGICFLFFGEWLLGVCFPGSEYLYIWVDRLMLFSEQFYFLPDFGEPRLGLLKNLIDRFLLGGYGYFGHGWLIWDNSLGWIYLNYIISNVKY